MTLFLLSTVSLFRDDLKEKLKEELAKRGNKIAYISSEPQGDAKVYFNEAFRSFKTISPFIDLEYFDLSDSFSDEALKKITSYGTILLSGGNAFPFLAAAKKRGLYAMLVEHFKDNGLVIGVSAGAIMLTPNIEIALLDDHNTLGLTDFEGFEFVDYEFYPHFDEHSGKTEALHEYCTKTRNKVMTCHNGEGILQVGSVMRTYGDISELKG
jgi:dipeptidase E